MEFERKPEAAPTGAGLGEVVGHIHHQTGNFLPNTYYDNYRKKYRTPPDTQATQNRTTKAHPGVYRRDLALGNISRPLSQRKRGERQTGRKKGNKTMKKGNKTMKKKKEKGETKKGRKGGKRKKRKMQEK